MLKKRNIFQQKGWVASQLSQACRDEHFQLTSEEEMVIIWPLLADRRSFFKLSLYIVATCGDERSKRQPGPNQWPVDSCHLKKYTPKIRFWKLTKNSRFFFSGFFHADGGVSRRCTKTIGWAPLSAACDLRLSRNIAYVERIHVRPSLDKRKEKKKAIRLVLASRTPETSRGNWTEHNREPII